MRKGVYPAHAGVILKASISDDKIVSISRTRGDDPERNKPKVLFAEFIPHSGGDPKVDVIGKVALAFISKSGSFNYEYGR